ncbi:CHASE2 domain-containing protein [Synechococcus sp. PCC 7336]|uniref:CHASE2 domain-containing protein n=1 Tax=Synechococcus sp. PCC 7336 TaxID=195250 RepID=UPI0003477CF7|nr:CHASE2 domain-containing protein [Synechococcus sp. PCC 7336]
MYRLNWRSPKFPRRLWPGCLALAAIGLSAGLGVWQPLELMTYNLRYRLRGARPWSDRIAVIEIDDRSLQQFGRFPISRQYYVRLLEILVAADTRTIAIDIAFPEPDARDADLADLMLQHGRVVLAQASDHTGALLSSSPEIERSAAAFAHIDKYQDADGITRRVELSTAVLDARLLGSGSDPGEPLLLPALAWAALEIEHAFLPPDRQLVELPELDSTLWLNWPSPVTHRQDPSSLEAELATGALLSVSLVDVLEGRIDPEVFADRFVLVGVTARGLDPLQTPFNRVPETSGVYMHAAALHNLLEGDALARSPHWWLVAIGVLVGPVLGWAIARYSARHLLAVVVLASGAWCSLSSIAFQAGYWLPVAWPVASIALTGVLVELGERMETNRKLERQINLLWKDYGEDLIRDNPLPVNFPDLDERSRDNVGRLATLAAAFGRSQSAQAAIADSLPVGLAAADIKGVVWFCNPHASAWLQLEVGDRLQPVLIPRWTTLARWQQRLQELAANRTPPPWEAKRQGRWYVLKLDPLFAQHNQQFTGVLLTVEDITTRREMQEQLVAQNRELERARQVAEAATHMKGAFLANMSHEIRTPMNAVVGLAGLLLETPLNSEQEDFVETIRASGDTLLAIINEILDFSKLEAGSVELEQIPFRLTHCIEAVVDLLAPQAQGRGLELVSWAHDRVPDSLQGDPTRISQILTNLIGNALKFTQTGGVTVEVSAVERSEVEVTLRFSVRDTGIGIGPQVQAKLFESFSQADVSTTRQYGGTGLGLAICKRLVTLMEGEIGVESELDVGSTFWFEVTLPYQPETVIEEDLKLLQGVRLVVADAFPDTRAAIAERAQQWGLQVETLDLATASTWLQSNCPQIVLVDLNSEEATALLEALDRQPQANRPYCIGMAPLAKQDMLKLWLDGDRIDAAISKPVKRARLLDALLAAVQATPLPLPVVKPPPEPAAREHSARILLAEDNRVNQKVALRQLNSLGYSAEVAANGQEVLVAMARAAFDVVLMDCQMPRMDGFEATRAIRQQEGDDRHTVVIAMTASALPEDRERCLAVGMDDFISKPVHKEDLRDVLERWTLQASAGTEVR